MVALKPTPPHGEPELTLDQQTRLVQGLRAALSARAGPAVALIETHISFVLVQGDRAWKIKKALRNSFLDASTRALRQHWCEEELRLNRRLAPAMYLGMVAVTGPLEAPEFGGAGPVLDHAVHMRAFAQEGLWDRLALARALGPQHIDELVRVLVPFHAGAAVAAAAGPFGTPAQVRAPMRDNLDELDRLATSARDHAHLRRLRIWEAAAFARLAPQMAARLARGRVRECHGDLHLGNVTQIDGRTTVFDGIEFNDDFRWIDVISELAFMAMDLHAHGLPALAHRLVNAYLQASGDYDGAALLPYYLVHRALVRAKVSLLRAAQVDAGRGAPASRDEADHYLALAAGFSRPGQPTLMLTHGFSGSGKTTLTQHLLEAAGAVRIRADVERKRRAGLGEAERSGSPLGAGLYSPTQTAATYAHQLELAVPVLQAGLHVILDATFLQRRQRDAARRLAQAQGVPCVILDFDATVPTLRRRLRERAVGAADASEADERVLELQIAAAEPLQADEAAAVFPCRRIAGGPVVEWAPLLARLARPAASGRRARPPGSRPPA